MTREIKSASWSTPRAVVKAKENGLKGQTSELRTSPSDIGPSCLWCWRRSRSAFRKERKWASLEEQELANLPSSRPSSGSSNPKLAPCMKSTTAMHCSWDCIPLDIGFQWFPNSPSCSRETSRRTWIHSGSIKSKHYGLRWKMRGWRNQWKT